MTSQSKSTLEHNTLPEHFMKDICCHACLLTNSWFTKASINASRLAEAQLLVQLQEEKESAVMACDAE